MDLTTLEDVPLPRLLVVAGAAVRDRFHRFTAEVGLHPGAFALLSVLGQCDGITHGEAAAKCWVSPASLTGMVDSLERDGLVERRRDERDRRVVRLWLTDGFRERAAEIFELWRAEFGRESFWRENAGLTEEEMKVVRKFLLAAISAHHDADPTVPNPFTEKLRDAAAEAVRDATESARLKWESDDGTATTGQSS